MNNIKTVLRPAGSSAARALYCRNSACNSTNFNLVLFTNGRSGYACGNGHAVLYFAQRPGRHGAYTR